MNSAPGSELLPSGERQLFIEQFEKDVRFFQLFFLLIRRSCPIKNVDLVWVEHGPSGRAGLRHLGITEALAGPNSGLLGLQQGNPHPNFCNLINGYGRQEAETCGRSDKAAEELIHTTGTAQVYRCHFGLVDIAVPIMVGGQHIATLFTGQVLREAPSAEGFMQIARDVADLPYIDLKELERAYWEVPVVSEEDIRNTTEILQGFAEYMANAWERMAETVKERRRKDREMQISRKEFAHYILEGSPAGTASLEELRELARRIGFTQPPNRVLVVRLEAEEEESQAPRVSLDLNLASALQAIEDLCDKLDNVVAAHLWKTGICVFLHEAASPRARSSEFHAHRLTAQIARAIQDRCDLRVRVGIGGVVKDWSDLAQSYREACLALAGSPAAVATYVRPTGSFKELMRYSEQICRLVKERRLDEARSAIVSLPMLISRRLGSKADDLVAARVFLSSVLESLDFTVRDLGCDSATVAALCGEAEEEFRQAPNVLHLHEIWVRSGSSLLEEVRRLYFGKRRKLVQRACQMIERRVARGAPPRQISIREVAAALGVSTSHLSRLFKRETGQTYEHFVMAKRMEMARRLLLDPLQNVSQAAQQCGFTDPSYFARVFRKVAGCTPTEFCRSPLSYNDTPHPLGE